MNRPSTPLGRLLKADLREAWASEAGDFTPWLAKPENVSLLGQAIGMDLEVEAQEKNVGPFRADILCKDTISDTWVLIENQLERTDHSHLGQLLTYAAGLKAVAIVWIAERFTEEHRAALDWLNDKTEEGIHFFGLELELWRIGDSPLAPKFNVVSKPNEWTKSVAAATGHSNAYEMQLLYWSDFVRQPELTSILAAPAQPCRQQNLTLPTRWDRWARFKLSVTVSSAKKRLSVYLMCRGDDGGDNFRELQINRAAIETKLGHLTWQSGGTAKGWIMKYLPQTDPAQTDDWPRQHQLLAAAAIEFFQVLDPYIQALDGATEG